MSEHIYTFDYGSINDDHKKAAAEIADLAAHHGNDMLAALIRARFLLKEIPKFSVEDSIFVQECIKADVKIVTQGYIREGIEPDIVEYPLLAICEDVRNLDRLVRSIKS